MGSPPLVSRLRSGCAAVVLCATGTAAGQVPAPPPAPTVPAAPPSAAEQAQPAAQPAPPPAPPPAASAPPPPTPPPPPPPPPPLDPPPAPEPTSRPAFLKTEQELERAERQRPRRRADEEPAPKASAPKRGDLPNDFVVKATPWVDFSLTSFWMADRSSNFLNLGVQVGGYFWERVRLSGRLIAPLEEARDEYDNYQDGYRSVDSRSLALLYGASLGLILSSSKTFLFAPGVSMWRADESDYGTIAALSLPFEWTTHRHLRVGFEMALGHAFGGSVQRTCSTFGTAAGCELETISRPGGTAVLLQYAMGWALPP